MPKFRLNKLVRDKLLDAYVTEGQKADFRLLVGREHVDGLVQKAIEEIKEVRDAPAHKYVDELADVQEVLDCLKRVLEVSDEAVRTAQVQRRVKRGSFDKGVFIKTLELEETNEWTAYYRREPGRYPES
jgi:predicted house-cleaning noncanonical NTP pyrophosphatase (MazG superfamily)